MSKVSTYALSGGSYVGNFLALKQGFAYELTKAEYDSLPGQTQRQLVELDAEGAAKLQKADPHVTTWEDPKLIKMREIEEAKKAGKVKVEKPAKVEAK